MAKDELVLKLSCGKSDFEVKVRLFNPSSAGTCLTNDRYYWFEQEVPSIDFERYFGNLAAFFPTEPKAVVDFGLKLDTSGQSKKFGDERGPTLFLDPKKFSREDFETLSACLIKNNEKIKTTFQSAVFKKRYFLLMTCQAPFPANGIARLVHGESPLIEIYEEGTGLILFAKKDQQIFHIHNYTQGNQQKLKLIGTYSEKEKTVSWDLSALQEIKANPKFLGEALNRSGDRLRNHWKQSP